MTLRWLTLILLLAVGALPAAAEDRVALVIGNANYMYAGALPNPVNDAEDVAASLGELGFDVLTGQDLTREAMQSLIDSFAIRAAGSDVALFYFAGHAFQVGGQNFLVPSDLGGAGTASVLDQAVSLDAIMLALEQAPGVKLVFLDACRDNPLGIAATTTGEGLARTGSAANFLIAYSTQPGAVAFDGDGRNGTFTNALLNHIPVPGQSVGEMMMLVRRDVIAATGGQQIPWESSSLTRDFEFHPGNRTASTETLLYQIAARSGSAELMSVYLQRYPRGAHVADAESALATRIADVGGTTGRGLPDGSARPEDDDLLWELAQRSRLPELAGFYLRRFPDGPHAEGARRMLQAETAPSDLGPGRLCERLATHPRDETGTTAGVEFDQLSQNAALAVETCEAAVAAFPEQPRYTALLARATIAAGRVDDAISLYQEAAARGDLRAQVSLGLLFDAGNGVPKDPGKAIQYYEQAAEGGSPDGAINLAVALYQGDVVPKDVARATQLLRGAAAAGSPIAAFNLGVLAQGPESLDLFLRAARGGEPRGYRAAATLVDEGRSVRQDPDFSASLLLRGAAEDRGEILSGIVQGSDQWSPQTIGVMQSKLKQAGFYAGAIDGVIGPHFKAALASWRSGGFDPAVLDE